MTAIARKLQTTPMAPYIGVMEHLEINDMHLVIEFMNETIRKREASRTKKSKLTDRRLDAALARFHGDWGGNKEPLEIASELRQGAEMLNDVETW